MRGKLKPSEWVTVIVGLVIIVGGIVGIIVHGGKTISECPGWVLFVFAFLLIARAVPNDDT